MTIERVNYVWSRPVGFSRRTRLSRIGRSWSLIVARGTKGLARGASKLSSRISRSADDQARPQWRFASATRWIRPRKSAHVPEDAQAPDVGVVLNGARVDRGWISPPHALSSDRDLRHISSAMGRGSISIPAHHEASSP